jgi:hypothetical protein
MVVVALAPTFLFISCEAAPSPISVSGMKSQTHAKIKAEMLFTTSRNITN